MIMLKRGPPQNQPLHLLQALPGCSGSTRSYLERGSAGIIDYWIKTGFQEKEEDIADHILRLSSATPGQLHIWNGSRDFSEVPFLSCIFQRRQSNQQTILQSPISFSPLSYRAVRHSSPQMLCKLCFVMPLGIITSVYSRLLREKSFCFPCQSSFLKSGVRIR